MPSDRPTDTSPPISGPRLSLLPPPSPLSLRISRLTLRRDPKREETEEEVTAEAVAEVAVEVAEEEVAAVAIVPETEQYDASRQPVYASAVSSAC